MISKILKVTVVVFALGLFTSCNSDDEGPAEAPSVKFSATVSGDNIRTDNATAVLSNEGKLLTIIGISETGSQTITLTIGSNADDAPLVMEQSYNTADEVLPASIRLTSGGQTFVTNVDTTGAINLNSFDLVANFVFGSFNGELGNTAIPSETISIANGAVTGIEIEVQ